MIKEFKAFISRGNVLDMAVGVVIGGAFTAIINSIVNDLINPIISVIIGGIDFSSLKIVITPAEGDVAEVAFRYGSFLMAVINFLIIAFVLFLVVKAFNAAKKKEEEAPAAPPAPSEEVVLLSEIRDLLKK